jgi:cytochrome c553
MGTRQRRRLIVLGAIVAVAAVAAVVVVLTGSASSDNPGLGTVGRYSAGDVRDVPRWVQQEHLPAAAVPGAKLFAIAGCTSCHTYAGSGTSALNAPDLTAIGSRHLGLDFEVRKLECPQCTNPGSPMPRFGSLGARHLRQLAVFLEASKGRR